MVYGMLPADPRLDFRPLNMKFAARRWAALVLERGSFLAGAVCQDRKRKRAHHVLACCTMVSN